MASNEEKLALNSPNQQLCKEFVAITGTDPELAVYYLGQTSWKIEDALDMFFDNYQPPGTSDDDNKPLSQDVASKPQTSSAITSEEMIPTDQKWAVSSLAQHPTIVEHPSPSGLCVITWNIDGLDEKYIEQRTHAVCKILKSYSPDIIFLQEVIPETCQLICAQLGNYKPLPASGNGYFTLILLKKSTVTYISSKIEQFAASTMGRALQIVECKCASIDLCLMCTHSESTAAKTNERQRQFTRALYLMEAAPGEQTVIFGGDTNLRDKEVAKVGLPHNILDLWLMCGSPANAEYTWDLTKNDNLDWPYPNRPRLRFDRLYIRHAKTTPRVEPRKFTLIGMERLEPFHRFPSDHWGIMCDFKVTSPVVP